MEQSALQLIRLLSGALSNDCCVVSIDIRTNAIWRIAVCWVFHTRLHTHTTHALYERTQEHHSLKSECYIEHVSTDQSETVCNRMINPKSRRCIRIGLNSSINSKRICTWILFDWFADWIFCKLIRHRMWIPLCIGLMVCIQCVRSDTMTYNVQWSGHSTPSADFVQPMAAWIWFFFGGLFISWPKNMCTHR